MKSIFAKLLLITSLVCLTTSCVTEVSKDEFLQNIHSHETETINQVWYIGTADGFDYFIHNTAIKTYKLKVAENEFPLSKRFPPTSNQHEWQLIRIDPVLHVDNNIQIVETPITSDGVSHKE